MNLSAAALVTVLALRLGGEGAILIGTLILILARRLLARPVGPARWYSRLLSDSEGIPYGVAIAAAGIALVSPPGSMAPAAVVAG